MQQLKYMAVISLPGSEDRLECVRQSSPFPITVVPGVNGRALSPDELASSFDVKRSTARYGRPQTRGEIGCSLAHVKALRAFLENTEGDHPDTLALICEDDVQFKDGAENFIQEILSAHEHELTFLVPNSPYTPEQVRTLTPNSSVKLHRPMPLLRGACAYLISRRAALAIVSAAHRPYWIADDYQWYRERGIDVLATDLGPITLQNVPSVIDSGGEHRGNAALEVGRISSRWRGTKSFATRFGSVRASRLQMWHRNAAWWAHLPAPVRMSPAGRFLSILVNDMATGHTLPQRLIARLTP